MVDGLLFADAVCTEEFLITDICRIGLERIQCRYVPPEEYLQLTHVDERGGIFHDSREEPIILFVSPQLSLSVCRTCDYDRFKTYTVFKDVHVGIESELPAAVAHGCRDNNLERKINLSLPFCNISETCGDHCRIKHVRCHHLTCLIILDCLHDDDFGSVIILELERITRHLLILYLRHKTLLSAKTELSRRSFTFA